MYERSELTNMITINTEAESADKTLGVNLPPIYTMLRSNAKGSGHIKNSARSFLVFIVNINSCFGIVEMI